MLNGYRYFKITVLLFTIASLLTACGGGSSSSVPTTIPTSASIYYSHNLVFRNSTTFSTGYNAFGQLGTGNLANRAVIGPLSEHFNFKGFATGGDHSVAFINNSTVRSWGYNGFGQLGTNSLTYSSTPIKTVNLSGVVAVAAGLRHSLALRNDDTLWAWGSNESGQLGVNAVPVTSDGYISKVPVQVTGGGGAVLTSITSIAANAYHSLALAGGNVWAWGLNTSGQLGLDPKTTNTSESSAPLIVPGLPATGITGIAAGGAFNCAVANDGSLWAWGNNDFGQLGNGGTVQSPSPVRVMKGAGIPLNNQSSVVKVVAGLSHALALLSDGSVWGWGYNIYGQLGNNSKVDSLYAVQVVDFTGTGFLSNVTDIRVFGSSSMAQKNGAWYAWGDNSYGQLGIGGSANQSIPVKMLGF